MQAFEIGQLRGIARLYQGFEAGFHQLHATPAQHGLLTEQVGLGLILEGGLDDARAAAADAAGVGQCHVLGLTGGILKHGHQVRDTPALGKLAAHRVARRLGRHHDDVQIGPGHHLVVVNRKAVGEGQGGPLPQIRLNLVTVQLGLELIGRQHHHQVRTGDGLGNRRHGQSRGSGFGSGG